MVKFGLQLYTVRKEAALDFPGTMAKVAAAGYQGVEFAMYHGLSAAAVSKGVRDSGLEIVASLLKWGALEDAAEASVEYCALIGSPAVTSGGVTERPILSADEWRRIADRFNFLGELCKQHGMRFMYHVHGNEFEDVPGGRGMAVLLDTCDPTLVGFEPDTFWLTYAGVNPAEFLRLYGDRCSHVHFKDMGDSVTKRFVEVGTGIIDMPDVVREAKKRNASWFVVEQDAVRMPVMESIALSLRNLRKLAKGN